MKHGTAVGLTVLVLAITACRDGGEGIPGPGKEGGIPAAEGLQSIYDTVTGIAKVSWYPSLYPERDSFVVFRGETRFRWQVPDTMVELGRLGGTSFIDSVRPYPAYASIAQYLVGIRDRRGRLGLPGDTLKVDVEPQWLVRTEMGYYRNGFPLDPYRARVGDTVTLTVQYSNRHRGNRMIAWTVGGPDSVSRQVPVSGNSGFDNLVFIPSAPFSTRVEVSITDEAGTVWTKDWPFYVDPKP